MLPFALRRRTQLHALRRASRVTLRDKPLPDCFRDGGKPARDPHFCHDSTHEIADGHALETQQVTNLRIVLAVRSQSEDFSLFRRQFWDLMNERLQKPYSLNSSNSSKTYLVTWADRTELYFPALRELLHQVFSNLR